MFRGNATNVRLNVMIFKLCDRGSAGLSKPLLITKINFEIIERKKKNYFFFAFLLRISIPVLIWFLILVHYSELRHISSLRMQFYSLAISITSYSQLI